MTYFLTPLAVIPPLPFSFTYDDDDDDDDDDFIDPSLV
jgi:hypothetical protein